MFAKLLAELKRIAILLQSKKLVDKDYVPDEGGGSETDDKFYLVPLNTDNNRFAISGVSFQKSDLIKIDFTTITQDYLANELFTTKGIDVINKIIKNLRSDFITGGYWCNYIVSIVESIDYNLVSLPNKPYGNGFALIGFNTRTEAESIRRIEIRIPIDNNSKIIFANLSEGSYLTENTQFTYRDDGQE